MASVALDEPYPHSSSGSGIKGIRAVLRAGRRKSCSRASARALGSLVAAGGSSRVHAVAGGAFRLRCGRRPALQSREAERGRKIDVIVIARGRRHPGGRLKRTLGRHDRQG